MRSTGCVIGTTFPLEASGRPTKVNVTMPGGTGLSGVLVTLPGLRCGGRPEPFRTPCRRLSEELARLGTFQNGFIKNPQFLWKSRLKSGVFRDESGPQRHCLTHGLSGVILGNSAPTGKTLSTRRGRLAASSLLHWQYRPKP
jgi:hypothetical protein